MDAEETEELRRFREEWKKEVQSRNQPAQSSQSQPLAADPVVTIEPRGPIEPGAPTRISSLSTDAPLSKGLQAALTAYRQAVRHEEHGEYDQALVLYRQAFRKDANVDRSYYREQMIAAAALGTSLDSSEAQVEQLSNHMETKIDLVNATAIVTGTLASLVASFPETLTFEAEDELQKVPVRNIPDELIVNILRLSDPTSIERFATTTRKARVLSLDASIWRELVNLTYKPPQLSDLANLRLLADRFRLDYRRLFVEHPRIRIDGVYIAVCHYIRYGLGENPWVNTSQLITYHRFLRFYPDGQVVSLLANEEHPPSEIIHLLKPSLRMKGLSLGTWRLSGTTVQLSNLLDPSPSPVNADERRSRYSFAMSLTLRSRPVLGRWNRLEIASYDSVNLETGDIYPVKLKHERPFWFSKVRSYSLY
ncbi:hypothetical protein C8J56DRAFT_972185 [Mycena floridula]|nr:hypothetical protein C8J56DRAFT_972185 [Mycena floridula]